MTVSTSQRWACFLGLLALLTTASATEAQPWICAGGDSVCLSTAMRAANTAPGTYATHVIMLGAGTFTYTTPDPSAPNGDTALPPITGGVTILGAGADQTIIMRDVRAPQMRLFEVALGGTLVLADATVQYGSNETGGGGALKNQGTLALYRTIVRWNFGTPIWTNGVLGMIGGNVYGNNAFQPGEGGALDVIDGWAWVVDSFLWWNNVGFHGVGTGILVRQGHLTIDGSTISQNVTGEPGADQPSTGLGGGIANGDSQFPGGEVLIRNSFIGLNRASTGAAIHNQSVMELVNTTVAGDGTGGANNNGSLITNSQGGTLLITQSTLVHPPQANDGALLPQSLIGPPSGSMLDNIDGVDEGDQGIVLLQNTIIWGTSTPTQRTPSQDCRGTIISLGNNLIGDPTGCAIVLQAGDRTGDPGPGTFVALGIPGHEYFPLLPTSQALGAANPSVCPQTDQIGMPRKAVCDIGAIESGAGTGNVAQR